MRSKQNFLIWALLFGTSASSGLAQQPAKDTAPPKSSAGAPAGSTLETETIPPPRTAQPADVPGFMDPAQVKALTHQIWIAEFRINDLLTELHPEKWKASKPTLNSFNQTFENLHKTLEALEGWRAQFEKRPDSIYFGFQTYAAMNAALPRLDGVGRAASQFENTSLGAQYSQADNRLFDLQQALQPYIAYLLHNPDQMLALAQSNLAGCQDQLGVALRGQSGPAKPLKNTFVEFHARRRREAKPEERKLPQDAKKKPASEAGKKVDPPSATTAPPK